MDTFGEAGDQPAPVYPDGVPDDQGGIPKYMIQFTSSAGGPLHVDLMNLTWIEANETNSVLFK